MNYKKYCLSAIVVLGLSSCVTPSLDGKGYDMTVPLSSVNSTIAKNFPQKKKTDYGTLLIEKPDLLAKKSNDTLGIGSDFTFSNMLIPNGIKGKASLSSGLSFNASDKGIYLANPMVDELKFQDFALSKYLTPQVRTLIGKAIAQQLKNKPIYKVDSMGSSLVKNVAVKNGDLVLSLGL